MMLLHSLISLSSWLLSAPITMLGPCLQVKFLSSALRFFLVILSFLLFDALFRRLMTSIEAAAWFIDA